MEIRIVNSDIYRLRQILGELANKLNLKAGDTTIVCETEPQLEVGRQAFERLISQGWAAYSVEKETGKTRERLTYFAPDEKKVVMFGPIAGG